MTGLPVIFSPRYEVDIGEHVFRTEKFRGVYERLRKSNWASCAVFHEPQDLPWEDFSGFLTEEYLGDLQNARESYATLRSELPVTSDIIFSQKLSASGTSLALTLALTSGCSIHLGGGFHHAYPDHAEGFCYINDIAFAIHKALEQQKIRKALVVDCDLHQGNGTAAYFSHKPFVFTFSMHQGWLYPIPKERSNLDIELALHTGDEEYLNLLRSALNQISSRFEPDVVIYQAGVDVYEEDLLGSLKITRLGLKKRDEMVLSWAKDHSVPVVVTMGGGYPPSIETLIDLHFQTVETAFLLFCKERCIGEQ
ncbi:MAG: histone deacetylase family protein [bacterium JZ-2024 1]